MPTQNNNCEKFDQYGLLNTISDHFKNESVVRLRFAGSLRKFCNHKFSQMRTLCNFLMCNTAKNRKSAIKSLQNQLSLLNQISPCKRSISTEFLLWHISGAVWSFYPKLVVSNDLDSISDRKSAGTALIICFWKSQKWNCKDWIFCLVISSWLSQPRLQKSLDFIFLF